MNDMERSQVFSDGVLISDTQVENTDEQQQRKNQRRTLKEFLDIDQPTLIETCRALKTLIRITRGH